MFLQVDDTNPHGCWIIHSALKVKNGTDLAKNFCMLLNKIWKKKLISSFLYKFYALYFLYFLHTVPSQQQPVERLMHPHVMILPCLHFDVFGKCLLSLKSSNNGDAVHHCLRRMGVKKFLYRPSSNAMIRSSNAKINNFWKLFFTSPKLHFFQSLEPSVDSSAHYSPSSFQSSIGANLS